MRTISKRLAGARWFASLGVPFCLLLTAVAPGIAATAKLSTIYIFTGSAGAYPEASLLIASNGSLYGTSTQGGGGAQGGTVFQLTPVKGARWTATKLYSFPSQKGSLANPTGLIFGAGGTLVGATANGGLAGKGTVFELTPSGSSWTESTLYNFTGQGSDGAGPSGNLVADVAGTFYGVTAKGGTSDAGTVFSLAPPSQPGGAWTKTTLHSFGQTGDGMTPNGSMVINSKGALFGVTSAGGASGDGIAFELAPPAVAGGAWTETVLYSFAGGSDGASPQGGLALGKHGTLYGATMSGGVSTPPASLGTVFLLTPPASGSAWTETVLYNFQGGSDGANPVAGVVLSKKGNLYGATSAGGEDNLGTVFELAPPATGTAWTETVLNQFYFSNGSLPVAGLAIDSTGALYGATENGGQPEKGTVFKMTP
jgi:uncharacterized repeat protein (TIGR03803 family)